MGRVRVLMSFGWIAPGLNSQLVNSEARLLVLHLIPTYLIHSRQPSLSLHDLCLEILTVHGNELSLFGTKAFPLLKLFDVLCLIFNVFVVCRRWKVKVIQEIAVQDMSHSIIQLTKTPLDPNITLTRRSFAFQMSFLKAALSEIHVVLVNI